MGRRTAYLSLVLVLLIYIYTVYLGIRFPYGLDYGEGPLLDQVRRLLAGESLYKPNLDKPPFMISNYPPLYVVLTALISRLTHLPPLAVARGISALAGILAAMGVAHIAQEVGATQWAGALAAALFLSHPFLITWLPYARVDMLALGLSLAGLAMLVPYSPSRRRLVTSMVLLAAAIYARQTYALAAPLASVIWVGRHDRRQAGMAVAVLGAFVLVPGLLLQVGTRGGFLLHVVVANVNPYDVDRLTESGKMFLQAWPIAVLLALVHVAVVGYHRIRTGQTYRPVGIYLLLPYSVGAIGTAIAVGKVGSNVNYYLELIAALAIWSGSIMAGEIPRRGPTSVRVLLFYLAVSQISWGLIADWLVPVHNLRQQWDQLPQIEAIYDLIEEGVHKGPVIADDHMVMVVKAGQSLYYQPFEYGQLYNSGLWSGKRFLEDIRVRKFPLIMVNTSLREQRWPPGIWRVIEENYEMKERCGILAIYTPRGEAKAFFRKERSTCDPGLKIDKPSASRGR